MPIEGWRYTPKNALMYAPDGVENAGTVKASIQDAARRKVKVNYQHTRFTETP